MCEIHGAMCLQATDISQTSGLQPAFELVYNTQPWVAPFNDDFAEPENPVPYQGGSEPGFSAGFGNNLANGHVEVSAMMWFPLDLPCFGDILLAQGGSFCSGKHKALQIILFASFRRLYF